jgi:hypothetical protein
MITKKDVDLTLDEAFKDALKDRFVQIAKNGLNQTAHETEEQLRTALCNIKRTYESALVIAVEIYGGDAAA